jgi:predicted acyltransferase
MVLVGGNALAPSWLLIYAAGSEQGLLFFSASGRVVLALYVVSKLLGKLAADETGKCVQYDYWK